MEDFKIAKLGKSKLVPSVKELAKQPILAPPSRYIRSDQGSPVIFNPTFTSAVPVIDMEKLVAEDTKELELQRLHSACMEWGFFQLVNHGVNSTLVEKVKQGIQDFFELPLEEKKRFWQQEDDVEGYGQAFVFSDEQKLDWADLFFMTTLPRILRRPRLFPELPLPLRESLDEYSSVLKDLAMNILAMTEIALKVETKEITELFEYGVQSMRMNYYPPCHQPDKVIGLTPHSDPVGLTILLQVNEIAGLQIKKEGAWIPIEPLPNAFILNIGVILEIVSNGTYPSIEHRATVSSVKERLSIATFYSPNLDAEFGPAKSLITPTTPALYRTTKMEDYVKEFYARELSGKSYVDVMKIENVHGNRT